MRQQAHLPQTHRQVAFRAMPWSTHHMGRKKWRAYNSVIRFSLHILLANSPLKRFLCFPIGHNSLLSTSHSQPRVTKVFH
ncbi:hypothetical protein WJX74_003117 [Apatococcus lobatus]|uniref:Uncharacterized protein n=2 Tax=Apatococcus TaxID=904362 RepID=A0AAW1TIX5_9CHLO